MYRSLELGKLVLKHIRDFFHRASILFLAILCQFLVFPDLLLLFMLFSAQVLGNNIYRAGLKRSLSSGKKVLKFFFSEKKITKGNHYTFHKLKALFKPSLNVVLPYAAKKRNIKRWKQKNSKT